MHFYRDVTLPAGETNIAYSYQWVAQGEGTYDFIQVSIGSPSIVPVAASGVAGSVTITNPLIPGTTVIGAHNLQGTVQTVTGSFSSAPLGNCAAPVTIRVFFTWRNDGSAGTQPPGAVDNISLVSSVPAGGPLSGTVTVGPTGTYTSLTAAVNAVNTQGVSGPVVLELQSTYTSASEVFPITLAGSTTCNPLTAVRTVTIRPAAGAVALSIVGTNAGPTIDFNSGQWWRIDGRPGGAGSAKELTISNTSTTGQAIRLINEGSNNIVRYCNVIGVNTSTVSGVVLYGATTGANGNDNNLIEFCDIHDGATTPVNCVYGSGSTTTPATYNNGNTISNCNIYNYFHASSTHCGISITSGNSDMTITGNSFYQTASRATSATVNAVLLSSSVNNGFLISNNFIGGTAPNAGGSAMTYTSSPIIRAFQITVGTSSMTNILNNTFQNISITSSSTSAAQSLISLLTGRLTCSNNTIGSQSATNNIVFSLSGSAARLQAILAGTGTPEITIVNGNVIGGMALQITGAPATVPAFFVVSMQGTTVGHTFTFNNNIIGSPSVANSITSDANGNLAGIITFSNALDQSFQNNTFSNLTNTNTGTGASVNGMLLQGSGTSPSFLGTFTAVGNTIRDLNTASSSTTFVSAVGMSVSGTAQTTGSNLISQNTIHSIANTNPAAATLGIAALFSVPTAIPTIVSRNFIHSISLSTTATTGILRGIQINAGTATYQNNMVRMGINTAGADITTGYAITGITEASGATSSIYHNSVYVGGAGVTASTSNTFAFTSGSTTTGRNYRDNIFVNARSNGASTGKHYAIAVAGTVPNQAGLVSEYNLLQATGTGGFIGLFNAVDQATIANWRTATGNDWNSISADPQYINPTGSLATLNLHIQAGIATPVEGAGALISSVSDDFDGQARAGLTPADLGADGGNFVINDISVPGINYTALTTTCGNGNIFVGNVAITDATGVPTAGALVPRIYYRKGAGTWFSQAGTLASGSGTNGSWNFTIVVADMGGIAAGDVVSYYVIAQDLMAVPNIGSIASGVVATNVNTVTVHPVTPATLTVLNALSGTYTVGAGGNFTTLTAAVAAYNTGCLAGPVVFSLTDATYTTPAETFPITINQGSGASAVNTLTIRPAANNTATVTGSATALIKLNGADFVIIDGSNNGTNSRNLSFINTNTAASTVLWNASLGGAGNGANNNTFKNLIVTGGIGTTSGVYGIISCATSAVGTAGDDNDNFRVENCAISKVYNGISILGSVLAADGLVLTQNLIGDAALANYVTNRGIEINTVTGASISQNTIFNIITLSTASNAATGIDVGANVINGEIVRNNITAVYQPSTGGWNAYGIYFSSSTGTTGVLVANNFISDIKTVNYSTTSSFNAFGIRFAGGTNLKIYNNSINMFGDVTAGSSAGMSANIYIGSTLVTGLDMRNNIFSNSQNFGVAGSFAYNIYMGTSGFTFGTINFNDYTGASGSNTTLRVGYDGLNVRTTLPEWRTFTGQDVSSIAVPAIFTSNTDLHLNSTSNQCLDGGGTPLASVPADYDNQARNATTPDIGADEFTNPNLSIVVAETSGAANNDGIICNGATATLTATGGGTYTWSTSATTAAIAVSPTVTTTYTVTVTNGTCTDVLSTTITVNPVPTAFTVTGGGAFCAPGAGVPVGLNGSQTGINYQLQRNGSNTGAPVAGTNAAISFGNQTVSGTYTVVATNPGTSCTSSMTGSVIVTANLTPATFAVTGGGAYCAPGAGVPVGLSGSETGVNYSLFRDGNLVTVIGGTGNALSFGNQTVAGTYQVIGNAVVGNCQTSMSGSAVVVANATPSLSETHVEPTTCISTNGSIDLTVTGGVGPFTYNWSGAGIVQGQEDQANLAIGTYNVTVSGSNGCSATLAVTLIGPGGCDICPTVGAISASPQTVCLGSNVTYSATGLANMGNTYGIQFVSSPVALPNPYSGGTVIGTVSNGSLGNGGTTAQVTAPANTAGTVFIYAILSPTPVDPTCRPAASNTQTTNPIPQVNAVTNQVYCAGSSVPSIVFTSSTPGAVFTWSRTVPTPDIGLGVNSGTGPVPAFTASNTSGAPISSTFSVVASFTQNGVTCTGTPIQFTLTVNPNPTITAVANQTYCTGASVPSVVFTSNVPGAVFSWSRTNEAIGLGVNSGTGPVPAFTATNAGAVPLTSTFSVVASFTANGVTCTGTPIQFTITVNPTPTASASVTSQTVCNGSATTAISFTGTATIFNWTNNASSIGLAASGSGNIPSFTAVNTGGAPVVATITVTPAFINNGVTCTGAPTTSTITVNPTAQVNQPANVNACSGSPTAVAFTTTTTGTTYTWTNSNTAIGLAASGTGNISFTAPVVLVATTGTITVTPNYTNNGVSCPGTPKTFTITVNPNPTVNAVANQTLCSGDLTAAVTFSGAFAGTVFNWTNSNASIGLAASGTGNIGSFAPVNNGAATQVATITVTPALTTGTTTCNGTPITFTITVFPRPQVNVGADVAICENQIATLTAILGGGATGGTWTGGAGTFNSPATATTTYTPAASEYGQTITLTFTSNDPAGPCPAVSDALLLTINTLPLVNAGADVKICKGDVLTLSKLGATITANGSGVTTGGWSTSGTGSFQPNSNFPGATAYVPSAADYAAGFVTLTLTSADPAGPCNAVSDQVLLSFKGEEPVVCNDNVQVSLDPDGVAEILPDMVLEGTYDDNFFTVTVYKNNVGIGNTVNCSHVGQTLIVKVVDICTGNSCWGTIKVEDKLKPELTCTDIHLICAITTYDPDYLQNVLGITNAFPAVDENCVQYSQSYIDDWFDLDCDAQYSARIRRTWTAVDASGNKGTCVQNIYFDRKHVGDVLFPADVTISCSSNVVNTTPDATGAPYVVAFGKNWLLYPNGGFCEMQTAFVDQVLPVCDGTYKILRTWTAYDWCLPTSPYPPTTNPKYYIQVIKVLDDQGPAIACPANLTVSTDPFACCGSPNLPDVVVADACSRIAVATARVVVRDPVTNEVLNTYDIDGSLEDFAGNNLWAPDTLAVFGTTPCLPLGQHTVTYRVEDACGNTSTCTYRLTVDDGTPPVAACDQFTQVSLGVSGPALVNASTFDDGSYDNCSAVHFKARRMNQNDCQDNQHFFDQVRFCCDDLNDTILVVFRVYDVEVPDGEVSLTFEENNSNDCMVQVFVDDKLKPTCVPPANVTVSCENFDPSLWVYGFATSADNCCVDTITTTTSYSLFDTVCNKGTITRTFRAFDCGGLSNQCTQRVVVNYEQDYWLKFPNDVIVTVCDGTGNYGEPTFSGKDCELLGVSFEDEIFTVVPDACYKIERTWTILNWCTYNPNSGCINVPNPNPNAIVNHPSNLTGPTVSPAGTPAPWNPTVLAITPGATPTNFSIYWDPNANCYKYKQIIKIIDTQAPVVDCPASPVNFCDLTPNDPLLWNQSYWWDATMNSHDLCEGPTDLNITGTDLCSGSNIDIRYLLFLDLDGDGTMETVISSTNLPGYNNVQYGNAGNPNFSGGTPRAFDNRPVPSNQKYGFALETTTSGTKKTGAVRWNTQQSPNTYVVPELPYGTHKIKWIVSDGCGNERVCEYTFVVKDCKAPTVVCLNGLSVNIMPTKMIQLWATDFLQYTEDNCTPSNQIKLGIRRSGTGTGFPYNPDGTPQTGVTFTCDDLGTQLVELWGLDAAGNADYCETYVIVQDNNNNCNGAGAGNVAGYLKTEADNGLEDAHVDLNGNNPALPPGSLFGTFNLSDANGHFSAALPLLGNYTITPTKDNDPLNGVSTFDLVLINKHILGLEPLSTPYKMIAADANNSRSLTTFDIVELRKLILGIYTELPNNTSWRFVDKSFTFPSPTNPFQTIFPETKQIADLSGDLQNQDFVAVKVGDVNGNAVTSSLVQVDDRTAGTLLFDANDRQVHVGETFTVTLRAAEKVKGYQFSLYFPNLEVVDVAPGAEMTPGNFGIFNGEHALTTSFDNEQVTGEFSITFRAETAGNLSQLMQVSSRITKAEAYGLNVVNEKMAVALRFNGSNGPVIAGQGFELYQNTPNPWVSGTQIGFYLPEAAEATLTIFDETGRTLLTQKGNFGKGYNALRLDRAVVNTTGVLYYKVETATDSAVKKMIQTK